jgi:hypothetical protein
MAFTGMAALPTGFGHTWQLAQQRHLTEADAADREFAYVGARTAAAAAAIVELHFELWRALPLFDFRCLSHSL